MNKVSWALVGFFLSSLGSTPVSLFSQTVPTETYYIGQQIELAQQEKTTGLTKPKKNQLAFDVGGRLNFSLSYARRIGDTNFSCGGGLGYGSFYSHSFEGNIFATSHVELFARYQPSQGLQLDFGATGIGYYWTDDCSECTGTFIGLYFSAGIGHRIVFIGPWLRIGYASDNRNRSGFGIIRGLQLRWVIGWGK